MRGQSEQAVKSDLALRAVAVAENFERRRTTRLEGEYARMAMQYGQKAKEIRKAYEQNDAVSELLCTDQQEQGARPGSCTAQHTSTRTAPSTRSR